MINKIHSHIINPVYEELIKIPQTISQTFNSQVHSNSSTSELVIKGNGDNRTDGIEGVTYVAMDVGNAANRGIGLAGLATLNGAFFIGLGSAYIYTGLAWVTRDAKKEYKEASEIASKTTDNVDKQNIAEKKLWAAKLGVASTAAFVAAGVALVGLGVIILLGKTLAAGLKFALVATGAVYIGRGLIMMRRSWIKYNLTQKLHEKIKTPNLSPQNIIQILDNYCCFGEDNKDLYTGKSKEEIETDLPNFLKELDKQLYIQKCQFALGGLIGFLMFAGGGISVAGATATGGASTVLTYVSLGVFAVSEMAFIPYDSGYLLNKVITHFCPYDAKKEQLWITSATAQP